MEEASKTISNCIKWSVIAIPISVLVGVILLMLVSLIPDECVSSGIQKSFEILENENARYDWGYYFTHAYGARTDTCGDSMLLLKLRSPDRLTFAQRFLHYGHSTRYWGGSAIFLRPFMSVASLMQLRYINLIIMSLLLWYILIGLRERIGYGASFAFLISIIIVNLFLSAWSIISAPPVLISLSAMAWIIKHYTGEISDYALYGLFGVIGILEGFFDSWSIFLITLELPLVLLLLINLLQYGNLDVKRNFHLGIVAVLSWGMNYSVFWAIKWVLNLLVRMPVEKTSTGNEMLLWIFAEGDPLFHRENANRFTMLLKTLGCLLPTDGNSIPFVIAMVTVSLFAIVVVFFKKHIDLSHWKSLIPLFIYMVFLPIGTILFVWYWAYVHASVSASRFHISWIFGFLAVFFTMIERPVSWWMSDSPTKP